MTEDTREAIIEQVVLEMSLWSIDNAGHYHEDDIEERVKSWTDRLAQPSPAGAGGAATPVAWLHTLRKGTATGGEAERLAAASRDTIAARLIETANAYEGLGRQARGGRHARTASRYGRRAQLLRDAAAWLQQQCDHEKCIAEQTAAFHETLDQALDRAEAAEQALAEKDAEIADLRARKA